jgi:tetratricopeptide (TPR) repeat protein
MARARVMKIDSPAALGKRLAAARAERGLSLRQLAFEGCTSAYISTIENGRRVPSLQVLQVLADRLDVGVDYLARGEIATRDVRLRDAELAVHLGDHVAAREALSDLTPQLHGRRLARALALEGLLDVQEGEIDRGVDLLEKARQLHHGAFASIPNAVESLGRTYATRGEYESAIALFTEARDDALASGDRPRALKDTVLLANAYIDLGDLARSADALAEALRGATELRDPMLRATVLWSQARLHTVEGRQDLAASFAERALEIIRSNEDERAVGLAHQMLAYVELERGNAEHALELLDAAQPLVARAGDAHEQAALDLDRARALLALGQLDDARALLQRVAPLLTEFTGGDGGRCLLTLAELYDRLDECDDALAMYDLAIDRLRDHRNPHLVRALRMKSELLGRIGRTDEAYQALKDALDVQDWATQRSAIR